MREPRNIAEVSSLSPDFMGFIFYPPSPRYCGDMDPDVVRSLHSDIVAVAVTVDMTEREILSLVGRYGFRAIQLHGNESPGLCRRLRDRGLFVIKAIPVKDRDRLDIVMGYEDVADLLVLDTATASKGGSGKKFDWNILAEADIRTDFLLSGGIGAGDADAIAVLEHPHLAGIDLNSRFEVSPGLKDVAMLRSFLARLRGDTMQK